MGSKLLEAESTLRIEPCCEKTCILPYANNKGAGPRSLIGAVIVRCFDSITPIVATPEIPRLQLVSVAEQARLSLNWSEAPEDRFSRDVAQIMTEGANNPVPDWMKRRMTKSTKCPVRSAYIQVSLCNHTAWSQLCCWALYMQSMTHSFFMRKSKIVIRSLRIRRLIWVFADRKCHYIGFASAKMWSFNGVHG